MTQKNRKIWKCIVEGNVAVLKTEDCSHAVWHLLDLIYEGFEKLCSIVTFLIALQCLVFDDGTGMHDVELTDCV